MNQKLLSGNVVVKIHSLFARTAAAVVGATRLLAVAFILGGLPAWAFNTPPTIANNTFPATNVGQTLTQTVTLTLTSASAIKSIVISPASATSSEYKLNSITGCTVDGTTSNATGTVCSLSITYTAPLATSPNPPQILYTDAGFNVTVYGTAPASPTASVTYASTLTFNPAQVAVPPASAQTLTATFTLNGFSTALTPTAALHYGLAYTAGAVSCSGSVGNQTCTVPVTFLPNYPGGRKDAIFLASASTRLATVLVYGVGQAPFSMIQPGVVTNPVLGAQTQYGSVVDENGTVYVVQQGANSIETVTKAGVVGTLPITGLNSPRAIGIDGAGVIYVADQTPNSSTKTYDTVQGVQGSLPYAAAGYIGSLTIGNTGNLYETDGTNVYTVPISGTGTAKTAAISPQNLQVAQMVVDSGENLFISGYDINEITPGGVQTQVNTVGALNGLSVDAAGTLYATRYLGSVGNSSTGVAELPATNLAQYELAVDVGASPSGASVGPDGTVYVGNSGNLDKVDRTQGNLVFGEQYGSTPATQTAQLYNGGNLPLSISNIAISSNGGFTIGTASSNNCAVGIPVAPGAYCNLAVSFLSPHAGNFSGTLAVTTNSLNTTSTTQSITFSAFTYGVYVTASPSTLNFGNQTVGTTSAPQTVTFTNNGDLYSASIGNATLSAAGYNVTLVSCGSVGPAATCTASVTFSPTAVQSYNGVVATHDVSSNGGGADQLVTYTLNGSGVAASAPQAVLSPTSVAFGNQIVSTTSAAQTITLSNPGTASLTISGISITGTNAADFAISANTCGSTLAAAGSCSISVTFTPASTASFSAALSVADNVTGSPQTVALTGSGTTPQATLSPIAVFFGNQLVTTTSAAQTVTLTNPGTAALTISSVSITGTNAADFAVSANTCGSTLAVGANCAISVTFTPASTASFSATLSVADNATGTPQTVALTGTGTAPQASLSPTSVAFGNQLIGTTSTAQTLTLSNPGTAPLTISSISITGSGAAGFAISANTCGTTLAAAENCTISLTFKPLSAASFSASVSVADNATGSPQSVALTGTGTAPQASLSPTALSFGNQVVSTTSAAQTVTLSNPGTAALTISSISITGTNTADFAISANTCGSTLAAAGNCTISVSFTPASAASFSASLSVADNVTGSPQTVTLSGTGTAAQVNLSPSVLAFGNQVVNTTSTAQIVTLSNPGTAALTISSVSITGTNPAAFAISANTCGSTLPAAGTCTISLTFTPASAAGFSATLSVVDNVAGSPQTVALSGTGTLAQVSLSPTALAFGNQVVSTTSAAQVVTLSNPGTAALTVSGISLTGSNSSAFAILTNTCGSIVAAGGSCSISVTFTPSSAASFSASLSVADNVTGSPQTVSLSGTGTAAQAVVTPATLAFPSTTVGLTSSPLVAVLSNPGTASLMISGITLGGMNPADFALTNGCGSTLAAGASCNLSVTFTPASVSSFTATISVSDGVTGSPQTVSLSGTGVPPAVPVASLSPGSLTFVAQSAGTTSAAQTLTLSNTGNATLTITGITLGGANPTAFTQSSSTCGATLSAAASCTLSYTFSPTAAASYTAIVSVNDNAAGSPQIATLSGTGLAVGDFSMIGAPSALTVNPGGSASFTINVAALSGGFALPVTLSVTGLPTGAQASFAPAVITPGTGTATSVLTVQTSQQFGAVQHTKMPNEILLALGLLPMLAGFGLGLYRRGPRHRRVMPWLAGLALLTLSMGLGGCAGGYFGPPPQNYILTVAGTSTATQHSTTVTLTVQ